MKNHLKNTNLLLVWTTVTGLLLLATSVQADLLTWPFLETPTNTAGGTIVEEKEEEEAGGVRGGEGRFGWNDPEEPGGKWVVAANVAGFIKGIDCNEVCRLNGPVGFQVCNAPTAHPLVNTEAKFRYIVEEILGFDLGPGYSYVAENSPLHPGALVDQPGDTAFLKYNTNKKTATPCTGTSPDFARLCCCGPTTGLVCEVGPS